MGWMERALCCYLQWPIGVTSYHTLKTWHVANAVTDLKPRHDDGNEHTLCGFALTATLNLWRSFFLSLLCFYYTPDPNP